MVGQKEVVFNVLREFVVGVKEDIGCGLNVRKCKTYNIQLGECEDAKREGRITDESRHLEEGIYMTDRGEKLRGVIIFNVPVGEEEYAMHVLRDKAEKVKKITKDYTRNLEEKNPHEMWTMLQFFLQHRITYWPRICTPEEIGEMAELVDE